MPRRKIVIASMMHETNTFSPVPTPLESFRPLSGDAAIAELENTNTQVGGFLDVAQRMGAEIVVPLIAGAHPPATSNGVRTRTCATRSSAAFAAAATPRSSPFTARWWPRTWTTALCDGDGVTS